MKRALTLIALLSFASRAAFADIDLGFAQQDGGQAGAFLEYAGGARSLSMGGASTGVSDDASAVITNPAGLSQVQRKDIVTSYSALFENTDFGVFNYAQPTIDAGTFGIGLVTLQSKNFDRRDANGRQAGSFSASEIAAIFSHGIEINEKYAVGSSFKVIREEVASFTGTGYGLDGGALMRVRPNLQLGATLRNVLAPSVKLRNEKDTHPLGLRAGAKWTLKKFLVAFDLDKTANRSIKPYLGAEYMASPVLVLRGGLSEKEITSGVGVQLKDWGIDYAFAFNDAASGAEDLGSSHRFGFHVNFGKRVADQEVSLRWQKKGQEALAALRAAFDAPEPNQPELSNMLSDAKQVIRRQGYLRAQDLYAAQGYISYFAGEFDRSVQSLAESLALDPQNAVLASHVDKARAEMTEERTQAILLGEHKRMKELYEKGDWQGVLKSCERVLSLRADDVDALTYQEDARKRLNEPIERELKIAKVKYERGEYLDAIKGFQRVEEMDPQNQEASDLIAGAIAALEREAVSNDQAAASSSPAVYEIPRNIEESRALYSKGLVLYSQGNLKDAAMMWERAVQFDSKNVLARNAFNRAQIEMRDGR